MRWIAVALSLCWSGGIFVLKQMQRTRGSSQGSIITRNHPVRADDAHWSELQGQILRHEGFWNYKRWRIDYEFKLAA